MAKISDSFSVKDRVNNPVYGLGTISQVDDRYTTIAFDRNGTRKFVTSMVQIERSDVPAPPAPVRRKKAAAK